MLIKNYATHWPAFKNWQSDDYLRKEAGDDLITVEEIDRNSDEFAYFTKKYGRKDLTYGEFMDLINDDARLRNYYFAEQDVPVGLVKDIIEPEAAADNFMTMEKLFYWDGIGTKSLPH